MKPFQALLSTFLFTFFIASVFNSAAQTSAVAAPASTDTVKKKPKGFDYSHLLQETESDTKIFGKVNRSAFPKYTEMYAKGELFGDSFSKLNYGAVVEVLNTQLPLNKTAHRVLVKVIS